MPDTKQSLATLKWLLPNTRELINYLVIGLATMVFSNLNSIQQLLLLPNDFSFQQAILNSIGTVLGQLIGKEVSASLVTGIFWGLAGALVYILVWLISNFSAEVRTSIVSRKSMRPRGADANHALKEFVEHSLFRITSILILLFYINTLIQVLLPLWAGAFRRLAQDWTRVAYIREAALMLIVEIVALHIIAILLRLALLRKRVFGSYPM